MDTYHFLAEFLTMGKLCSICRAAQALDKPSGEVVTLAILTGELISNVWTIELDHIDWDTKCWSAEWSSESYSKPVLVRSTVLSSEAISMLEPYKGKHGKVFPAPVAILPKLKEISKIDGEWGAREIRRAVHREMRKFPRPDRIALWSKHFMEALRTEQAPPQAEEGDPLFLTNLLRAPQG